MKIIQEVLKLFQKSGIVIKIILSSSLDSPATARTTAIPTTDATAANGSATAATTTNEHATNANGATATAAATTPI